MGQRREGWLIERGRHRVVVCQIIGVLIPCDVKSLKRMEGVTGNFGRCFEAGEGTNSSEKEE